MLRMGRSAKPEQPSTPAPRYQPSESSSPNYAPAPSSVNDNSFRPPSESPATATRALAESESMARDIKEGRLSGFVGSGTKLTGETNFKSILRVDGHLTGKVSSEAGTLIVGATGQVDANIAVAAAVINGIVNGDIIASEKIELGRTARVVGNIHTPSLRIEDGAIFEGGCSMVKHRADLEKRQSSATDFSTAKPDYEQNLSEVFVQADETKEEKENTEQVAVSTAS